jgi:hypothetical protein
MRGGERQAGDNTGLHVLVVQMGEALGPEKPPRPREIGRISAAAGDVTKVLAHDRCVTSVSDRMSSCHTTIWLGEIYFVRAYV